MPTPCRNTNAINVDIMSTEPLNVNAIGANYYKCQYHKQPSNTKLRAPRQYEVQIKNT